MTRRLILLAVAVAALGVLGFWTYDRYLGRELRQGEELRDALAAELASAGFAFTSMKYDWRARRVVAQGLVATKLPKGVKGFSIGHAVYRGADPATIRAALADTGGAADAKAKPVELITDLVLSDVLLVLESGAEFKQGELNLKHLSLGKPPAARSRKTESELVQAIRRTARMARRLHVRLLEAKDIRFLEPKSQGAFEQKLLRLEDYRAGNFSEFRVEGVTLAVAVVFRARLDEYFVESVKARRFLANFHRSAFFLGFLNGFGEGSAGASAPAPAPLVLPPPAETAIIAGDTALIGFELLIPAMGRIAFEEISSTDRQFVNGLELGGKSKVVALELQFTMLTKALTAGLDALGVDLAAVASEAGDDARSWLTAHAGNASAQEAPLTALLRTKDPKGATETPGGDKGKPAARKPGGAAGNPPKQKEDSQIPMGPNDGKVEQGPAAPVPDVWGNEIEPPAAPPGIDNQKLAEMIRELGFDDLRIGGESEAAYDRRNKFWELSKFTFDIQKFWSLGLGARFAGVGALEDLGSVPIGMDGWWRGPKADAVGDRLMKEGLFEGFSFTYRDAGFLSRLLALIAREEKTTVEELASAFVTEIFSEKGGEPLLQAEGLADAVKAFLIAPEHFAVRLQPAEPVPFSAFPAMEEEQTPFPEIAARLGLVLTFNEHSFGDFKKPAPIGSDIESKQD